VGAALLAGLSSGVKIAAEDVSGTPTVDVLPEQAAASPEPLDTLRKRAEHGDLSAQIRLGDAYVSGEGAEVNLTEAARWYRRAAERGDTDAQVKLASLYRTGGRGFDMDRVAALRWLAIASTLSPRKREADIRMDREAVAREMKPEDATRAEAEAREWLQRFARNQPQSAQGERFSPAVDGIVLPRVVHEVRPNYTGDALRRKIRGVVWVEAVVLPDGSVGDVRVSRSLDKKYGLDDEALKAARQWRFQPGARNGVPVAVLVTIELSFRPDKR
jgi:TonB family protein